MVPTAPEKVEEDTTGSKYLVPIMGQVAYLTVASLALSGHYLEQFRWRKNTASGTSYYADWDTYKTDLGSTNYWKLGDSVKNYGGMTIWGVALLTQIASFFAA